ncbi:MAG: WYL domain-containing protein [Anaerolineales bacterium]|nr:WYL domain-containing protein [Anaerolineales bacterium]
MFDLSNCRFAFLDLETTGLSPWFGDRVCKVAIVLTEGKRIKATYQKLVNPGCPLSPAAASTNHLSDAELQQEPPFDSLAVEIEDLLEEAVVVAHNARFDLQFLDSEFHRLGRQVQFPNLIDTLLVARQYFDLPSYTLPTLMEAFHLQPAESHQALADALTVKALFFEMMDTLRSAGTNLDDVIGLYNSPIWPDEGIQLPIELGEAVYSGKRLLITYIDGDGQQTERWITPSQVLGLADYIYLQAFCHLREANRNFRLDRILSLQVEA